MPSRKMFSIRFPTTSREMQTVLSYEVAKELGAEDKVSYGIICR